MRHGERTEEREASHEAEGTPAPTRDEPFLLAESTYSEKALRYVEQQQDDGIGLAVRGRLRSRPAPSARPSLD
jgi:hypothetical protein